MRVNVKKILLIEKYRRKTDVVKVMQIAHKRPQSGGHGADRMEATGDWPLFL